jgi:hypothetical protein
VEKLGDLFEPVLKLKQKLPPLESLGQTAPETAAPPRAAKAKTVRAAKPPRKTVAAAGKRKAK